MEEKENQLTNNDKLRVVMNYFKEINITPPISVINAIEDVFNENDKIDNVDFYFKDGVQELQEDLTLSNEVNINLNGETNGVANDVFTYYGECNISLSEFTRLYLGEALIKDDITKVDNRDNITTFNTEDYLIILIEQTKFSHKNGEIGNYSVEDKLMVYCPVDLEDENE